MSDDLRKLAPLVAAIRALVRAARGAAERQVSALVAAWRDRADQVQRVRRIGFLRRPTLTQQGEG